MKKLFLLMLLSIFAFSCEKDDIRMPDDQLMVQQRVKKDKVDVCHYDAELNIWKLINVNGNAVKAHRKHGDVIFDVPDVTFNDNDNDGFYPINNCGFEPGGDCNDEDPSIYPGAPDFCLDETDQDCNGSELPCALTCNEELDCCFCSILDQIVWQEEAFYCEKDFGFAVQYYICPDEECIQWIETVIYAGSPQNNYCSYSLTGEQIWSYFNTVGQAQACTDFILSAAAGLELPMYCFPNEESFTEDFENERQLENLLRALLIHETTTD